MITLDVDYLRMFPVGLTGEIHFISSPVQSANSGIMGEEKKYPRTDRMAKEVTRWKTRFEFFWWTTWRNCWRNWRRKWKWALLKGFSSLNAPQTTQSAWGKQTGKEHLQATYLFFLEEKLTLILFSLLKNSFLYFLLKFSFYLTYIKFFFFSHPVRC